MFFIGQGALKDYSIDSPIKITLILLKLQVMLILPEPQKLFIINYQKI